MKNELIEMLTMQDAMNTHVHEQWRDQRFEWYRAIWVESAELLDHYGWKWWKHQTPDLAQVQLELVDIWHFGLSMMLQTGDAKTDIADKIAAEFELGAEATGDFREVLEAFVGQILGDRAFDLGLFGQLLSLAEMDFAELHRFYVGKNILNRFRQDHGYKAGTYQKHWQGREDNEHLAEVLAEAAAGSSGESALSDWVYVQLQSRYPAP